jgi:acetolactate synthase I/II/III large subunit
MTGTMPGREGPVTVAEVICQYLISQGVRRVYGLCGGHIQPIWDQLLRTGIEIVDTRHEGSAVYMAHAEAFLSGSVGVALVTAGPGLTNTITAIANAHVACVPVVVISALPPRLQRGTGAMQELPQAALVAPICRRVESVNQRHQVVGRLDAVMQRALGADGRRGPTYIDFPVDLLDETVHEADVDRRFFTQRSMPPVVPDAGAIAAGAKLIARAARPVVISGMAVRGAQGCLGPFLDATGALYLDTAESRGALPPDHPACVPAMRSRVMREADLVITLGRRLDYQLAYGSPAVFSPDAAFLRIGSTFEETSENRRGDVEIRADLGLVLRELSLAVDRSGLDREWIGDLQRGNAERVERLKATMAEAVAGDDGKMHPYRLISAINALIDDETIVVADGGDILSFARVGLAGRTYLDCGALGCLGVGVPFAVAASACYPHRLVIAVVGDGALGFTIADLDTAHRRQSKVVFVVANNAAWNIERADQLERYGGRLAGVELPDCRYDLVARGLGLYAERIDDPSALGDALRRCSARAPALLDVVVTRDARSPDTASGLATVPPRQALSTWDEAERLRLLRTRRSAVGTPRRVSGGKPNG